MARSRPLSGIVALLLTFGLLAGFLSRRCRR